MIPVVTVVHWCTTPEVVMSDDDTDDVIVLEWRVMPTRCTVTVVIPTYSTLQLPPVRDTWWWWRLRCDDAVLPRFVTICCSLMIFLLLLLPHCLHFCSGTISLHRYTLILNNLIVLNAVTAYLIHCWWYASMILIDDVDILHLHFLFDRDDFDIVDGITDWWCPITSFSATYIPFVLILQYDTSSTRILPLSWPAHHSGGIL